MEILFVPKPRKVFDEPRKYEEPVTVTVPAATFTHNLLQDRLGIGLVLNAQDEQSKELQLLVLYREFENLSCDVLTEPTRKSGESV